MDFLAIRLIDDQWSRDVQNGRAKFDPVIARGIHWLYQVWWENTGKDLPEHHADRRHGIAFVEWDVEELIRSHAEVERGETVTLFDEVPAPATSQSQIDIIRYALEAKNRYFSPVADPVLSTLVDAGWMCRGMKLNMGRDCYYHVTQAGAEAVGSKLPKE